MIVHRIFIKVTTGGYKRVHVHGWYLFGIIPIYIKEIH